MISARTCLLSMFLLALTASLPRAAGAEAPGSLPSLRDIALQLVNDSRGKRDLGTLERDRQLDAAAQRHANDMLARDYYSHTAPDGSTVQDRYVEAGGSRWKLVAENIARCRRCTDAPLKQRVRDFHAGWMNSPGHRQNVMAKGLRGFGFGIAVGEDGIFAVQTFAGPGTSRGAGDDAPANRLLPKDQADRALAEINRARKAKDLVPLAYSQALEDAANRMLPKDAAAAGAPLRNPDSLSALLPDDAADSWASIRTLAGRCGGCGTAPMAADISMFTDRWLDNEQYRAALLAPASTHLGFAMTATGDGSKTAVAVIGRLR